MKVFLLISLVLLLADVLVILLLIAKSHCKHEYTIVKIFNVEEDGAFRYKRYNKAILQCEKCGNVKIKRLL